MIVEITLFLVLSSILLLYFNRKPSYLPPGKWGWPIIGIIPGGRQYYIDLMKEYKENYGGGIYCSNIGTRLVVFLTDFDLAKKAFALPELCGRPDFFSVLTFGNSLGVTMSQGRQWHINRRFAIKNLREFGMGKSKMEQYIEEEIGHQIKEFDKELGRPCKIDWCIYVAIFNLAWQLSASTRFANNDEEMTSFYRLNVETFKVLQSKITFLDFYPWANYLPKYIKDNYLNANKLRENKDAMRIFLMKYIEGHKKTFDRNTPRDLIDMYFLEQEMTADDTDLAFLQNNKNLVNILLNFFNGSDVSGGTLHWFINLMAKHQDLQEKARKQIDEFVPRDRQPTWDDRKNLPYVLACVYEASRMAAITPFGVPHASTEDTHFENYIIPKGTVLLACMEEAHYDPKYWKHPERFYPEHFLDANGNFDSSNTAFSTFSHGKRVCIGKALTDMSLFMFAASMLQRYTFQPADGVEITYNSRQLSQFLNHPVNYDLILEKRP